jgi:YHS domain-containing protein
MTWVIVHEPSAWHLGPKPADQPVFLVRVTVPAGHANDAMRAEVISRIDRALRPPHSGDEPPPTAWIHIIEQPDGHLAINGDVMRLADITHAIVNPDVAPPPKPTSHDDTKTPTSIDPICGMSVTIDPDAISLTTDGTTHYFCSPTCRQLYSTTGKRHDP